MNYSRAIIFYTMDARYCAALRDASVITIFVELIFSDDAGVKSSAAQALANCVPLNHSEAETIRRSGGIMALVSLFEQASGSANSNGNGGGGGDNENVVLASVPASAALRDAGLKIFSNIACFAPSRESILQSNFLGALAAIPFNSLTLPQISRIAHLLCALSDDAAFGRLIVHETHTALLTLLANVASGFIDDEVAKEQAVRCIVNVCESNERAHEVLLGSGELNSSCLMALLTWK